VTLHLRPNLSENKVYVEKGFENALKEYKMELIFCPIRKLNLKVK
jgi:hypothetical protein